MITRRLIVVLLATCLPACSSNSANRFAAARRPAIMNTAQINRAQNHAALARIWNPSGTPSLLNRVTKAIVAQIIRI